MSIDSTEPHLQRKRGVSRRGFLLATTASLAVAGAEVSFPHIPYDTEPYDIRDSTLWRLFRGPAGGIMGLCGANDKDSNYWQWRKTPIPDFRHSALLKGDFNTFVRNDTWDNLKMSCDGIKQVYLLNPPPETTWRLIFQTIHHAPNGNVTPYETEGNLFTGKLKGPVKFMRGNGDVLIYALDEKGKRVPLSTSGPFSREDTQIPGRLV